MVCPQIAEEIDSHLGSGYIRWEFLRSNLDCWWESDFMSHESIVLVILFNTSTTYRHQGFAHRLTCDLSRSSQGKSFHWFNVMVERLSLLSGTRSVFTVVGTVDSNSCGVSVFGSW